MKNNKKTERCVLQNWRPQGKQYPTVRYTLIAIMQAEFYMHETVIVGNRSVLQYKRAWPIKPLNRTFYQQRFDTPSSLISHCFVRYFAFTGQYSDCGGGFSVITQ